MLFMPHPTHPRVFMTVTYLLSIGLCLGAATRAYAANEHAAVSSCSATITGDDAYRFTPTHLEVPLSCTDFTVTLKHLGRLPKVAMGHNWVLSTQADAPRVAKDGLIAGLDHNFIAPGDKRVIASTAVIGGSETSTTTFAVSALKAGETYAFQCTFGGHSPLMQGSLRLSQPQ